MRKRECASPSRFGSSWFVDGTEGFGRHFDMLAQIQRARWKQMAQSAFPALEPAPRDPDEQLRSSPAFAEHAIVPVQTGALTMPQQQLVPLPPRRVPDQKTQSLPSCQQQSTKRLLVRLYAARLHLNQVKSSGTQEEWFQMSLAQYNAFLDELRALGPQYIQDENRCELATQILKVPWAGSHGQDALTAVFAESNKRKKRAKLQDYTAIVHYFTITEWDMCWLLADVSAACKLETILKKCLSLGCRFPSEWSLKRFTSLWCLAVNYDLAHQMTQPDKTVSLKYVRTEWKRLARHAHDPDVLLETLPSMPRTLAATQPALYGPTKKKQKQKKKKKN